MSIRIIICDDLHRQCYCRFLFIFFLSILFVHLPLLSAISFNYPDFSNPQNLNRSEEVGFLPNGILSLTRNTADSSNLIDSVGRAVYSQEMHLWDNATGKVADFVTHFSFNISMLEPPFGGDGITFFLEPSGSQVPDHAWGGCLALISNCSDFNTTGKAVVAVEFDTYQNEWDPSDNHVGIIVNSIKSVANITWSRSIKNGSKANAWVTYNSQTRNLTSTGFRTEIHNILSWEFNSTEISTKPDVGTGGGGGNNIGLIVGCVIGGLAVVGGLFSVLVFYGRRNKGKKDDDDDDDDAATDDSMDHEFQQGTGPKRFSYKELVQATNNFSEEGKLGEGGFGGVYRGYLSDLSVAVKRVTKGSKQGRKEYMSEVKIISKLRHKNLVQLVGWCHEKGELLLIYELMPNGSLDSHLFRGENMLSWAVRRNIALGLASALLYLHEEWEQCVVHRDIKSSNVMLDSNFNTKLGDFGLARLMDTNETGLKTGLAGTFGYMAPEYISTGKASKGSDVFSFGVVALEIACGRRSMESRDVEAQISLVSWAWESYGNGRILDVVDRRLSMDFNVEEMECLLIVGLWCAHPDYSLRPSIRQALQVLNFEAALPNLPAKMPVPKYDVPSSSSTEPLLSTVYTTDAGKRGSQRIGQHK
ncbi:L-type lectin-domain containing receptor kinase IX.1 isoform X2 [Ricinus communis]|uniref:L-type lectin-domain containing receptor kinase IX.1 isoform X2 n=1 Tax=Ricinus communis TaxID=3988 RepID=UPI00201B2363|nr:L-type lectin-domain containing receptor kinase IX.1 isoform X2 [Ricinus communis]